MPRLVFASALLVLATLTAGAQEAVTIKIAHPKAGERARITVEEKVTTKTVFTAQGMPQAKEEVSTKSLVYIDDVLENPQATKRPSKLKRTYEKAVVGKDGQTKALSVQGKTVLIEKKGDTFSFTVEGQPVGEDSLKLLRDEFEKPAGQNVRDLMFPNKPVKPGDSWKIDTNAMLKAMGEKDIVFDRDKVAANGKLVKTYKKDGKQFGVIEFRFDGPIRGLGEKQAFKVKDGTMTLNLVGDGCIDGSAATGKSTSKMSMNLTGAVMNIDLKVVVQSTENRTTEQLPKK